MKKNKILIIDFDSTFITIESLEELARIALNGRGNGQDILREIAVITKLGMEGKITFPDSLARRLALFKPHKEHVAKLAENLSQNVSKSIRRNKMFFQEYAKRIFILSGGFREYMTPILKTYGIFENHILGNTFLFNQKGNVIGYDKHNPLAQEQGKVKVVRAMKFTNPIIMVGDGYTDYEVRKAGLAWKFIAFTENTTRAEVIKKADAVANSFEKILSNL